MAWPQGKCEDGRPSKGGDGRRMDAFDKKKGSQTARYPHRAAKRGPVHPAGITYLLRHISGVE